MPEVNLQCEVNLQSCEIKSYDELRAGMERIRYQIVEAKRNERANRLKPVKRFCKEFALTGGPLKDSLAEGSKKR